MKSMNTNMNIVHVHTQLYSMWLGVCIVFKYPPVSPKTFQHT